MNSPNKNKSEWMFVKSKQTTVKKIFKKRWAVIESTKHKGQTWYNVTRKSYQSYLFFDIFLLILFVIFAESAANPYPQITIGDKTMLGNNIR